jgi:hypothetical protein
MDTMTSEGVQLILVTPEPVHLTSDDDQLESREDRNKVLSPQTAIYKVLSPQTVIYTVCFTGGHWTVEIKSPIDLP